MHEQSQFKKEEGINKKRGFGLIPFLLLPQLPTSTQKYKKLKKRSKGV